MPRCGQATQRWSKRSRAEQRLSAAGNPLVHLTDAFLDQYRSSSQLARLPSVRAMASPQAAQPGKEPPGKPKRNAIRSILSRLGGGSKREQRRQRGSPRPLADVSNVAVPNTESQQPMLRGAGSSMQRGNSRSSSGTRSSDDSADAHGADTNASTRPITPSSLMTSGSTSNLSHSRSNATGDSRASTKPTTLLSTHSDGGANRIAQPSGSQRPQSLGGSSSFAADSVPAAARLPSLTHQRRDSGNTTASQPLPSSASITFSALPPLSPMTSAVPGSPKALSVDQGSVSPVHEHGMFRYPRYSQPQTKNNPHPSGLPPDNASTLTLASSLAPSLRNHGARHDEDASVRALPPSRRESDASLASKWSSAVLSGRARPASLITVGTTASTPLKTAATAEDTPEAEKEVFEAAREELTPPTTPAAVEVH